MDLTVEEKRRLWNKIRFFRVMHHKAVPPSCISCPHQGDAAWGACYGRKKLTYYEIKNSQLGWIVLKKPRHWGIERTYTVCETFFKSTK
jgi:hypothetical protein